MGMANRWSPNRYQCSTDTELLVSILVRYPELATVCLDASTQTLRLSFLVAGELPAAKFRSLRRRVELSVRAYGQLRSVCPGVICVRQSSDDQLTVLHVVRDIQSLSQEEIGMLVALMREALGSQLTTDDHWVGDDMSGQEEVIDQMLEDIRSSRQQRRLTALRDDGRVLVFNH